MRTYRRSEKKKIAERARNIKRRGRDNSGGIGGRGETRRRKMRTERR